ncbi:UNVERIFIED_CONTAM: hypothetical protein K2H54_034212 [Gekko kuhli]
MQDNLLQELDPDPLVLTRSLLKIKGAYEFMSDASQDAMPSLELKLQTLSSGGMAQDVETSTNDTVATIQLLQAHDSLTNFQKRRLSPSRKLIHLGARIDTSQAKVFLPEEREVIEMIGKICKQNCADSCFCPKFWYY